MISVFTGNNFLSESAFTFVYLYGIRLIEEKYLWSLSSPSVSLSPLWSSSGPLFLFLRLSVTYITNVLFELNLCLALIEGNIFQYKTGISFLTLKAMSLKENSFFPINCLSLSMAFLSSVYLAIDYMSFEFLILLMRYEINVFVCQTSHQSF